MSLGKLTLLSDDCDGSGAVVGSSGMVADSSGTEGAGCAGGVVGAPGVARALPAAGVLAAIGEPGPLAPRAAADAEAPPVSPLEAPEIGPVRLAALTGAGWRVACSAARNVTNAAPDKTTALRAINQIGRLFSIAHHPKAYCCTGAVRTVTPGQSQIRCSSGLPIGTPYDVASAVFGAQWIGDRR
jgi:hypothetical protein